MAIADNPPQVLLNLTANDYSPQSFDFQIYNPRDLKIAISNGTTTTDLVYPTDYTITDGNGVPFNLTNNQLETLDGGKILLNQNTVTFNAGDTLIVTRDIPENRLTTYTASSEFLAATLDTDLDRMVAMIQEINYDVDRTIHLDSTDPTTNLNLTLPAGDRSDKLLGFTNDGQGLTYVTNDFYNGTVSDYWRNNLLPLDTKSAIKVALDIPAIITNFAKNDLLVQLDAASVRTLLSIPLLPSLPTNAPAGTNYASASPYVQNNLLLLEDASSVKTALGIPTTFPTFTPYIQNNVINKASKTDLQTELGIPTTGTIITDTSLSNTLNDYTTTTALNTALGNYTTTTDLENNYVTTGALNSAISNNNLVLGQIYLSQANAVNTYLSKDEATLTYATINYVDSNYVSNTTLADYTNTADLNTILNTYLKTADASVTYLSIADATAGYLTKNEALLKYAKFTDLNPTTPYTRVFLENTDNANDAKTLLQIPLNASLTDLQTNSNTAPENAGTLALTTSWIQTNLLSLSSENSFNQLISTTVSSLLNSNLSEQCTDPILVESGDNTPVTCEIGAATPFIRDSLFKAQSISSLRRMLSREGGNVSSWVQAKLTDPRSTPANFISDAYVPLATTWMQDNFLNSSSAASARAALNIGNASLPIAASDYMKDSVFPATNAENARIALMAQEGNRILTQLSTFEPLSSASLANSFLSFSGTDSPAFQTEILNKTDSALAVDSFIPTAGMIKQYIANTVLNDTEINFSDPTLGTPIPQPLFASAAGGSGGGEPAPSILFAAVDPPDIVASQDMVRAYVQNEIQAAFTNFTNGINSVDNTMNVDSVLATQGVIKEYVNTAVQANDTSDYVLKSADVNYTDETLASASGMDANNPENRKIPSNLMVRCYIQNNTVTNANATTVAEQLSNDSDVQISNGNTCSAPHVGEIHWQDAIDKINSGTRELANRVNEALRRIERKYTDAIRELANLLPLEDPAPNPAPPPAD